jgi:hypothetical protein
MGCKARIKKSLKIVFSKLIFVHADAKPWFSTLGKIDESTTYSHLFSKEIEGSLKWNHYSTVYDELLGKYKSQSNLKVLEIGIQYGGSQRILKEYFHSSATIMGIDIDDECLNLNTGTLLRIGSSRDEKFLKSVVVEMGGVDIVIDDGSHRSSDQKIAFETLFPLLSNNGIYVVEDLEHSYFWKSGGVPYMPKTFWNYAKRTTELLNNSFRIYPKFFTLNVQPSDLFSVNFYPQIIAFHKLERKTPEICVVGRQYKYLRKDK